MIHLYLTVPCHLNPQHRAQGQRALYETSKPECSLFSQLLPPNPPRWSCSHRCHCVNPAKIGKGHFHTDRNQVWNGYKVRRHTGLGWGRSKKRVLTCKLFSKLTDKPGARTRGKPAAAVCFSKRRFKIKIKKKCPSHSSCLTPWHTNDALSSPVKACAASEKAEPEPVPESNLTTGSFAKSCRCFYTVNGLLFFLWHQWFSFQLLCIVKSLLWLLHVCLTSTRSSAMPLCPTLKKIK